MAMLHHGTPRGKLVYHGIHVFHGICVIVRTLGHAIGLHLVPWWTFFPWLNPRYFAVHVHDMVSHGDFHSVSHGRVMIYPP